MRLEMLRIPGDMLKWKEVGMVYWVLHGHQIKTYRLSLLAGKKINLDCSQTHIVFNGDMIQLTETLNAQRKLSNLIA